MTDLFPSIISYPWLKDQNLLADVTAFSNFLEVKGSYGSLATNQASGEGFMDVEKGPDRSFTASSELTSCYSLRN